MGGRAPSTGKNRGEPGSSPGSDAYEFLKTPHRLVIGVSTMELCGRKKRDLGGILRYV